MVSDGVFHKMVSPLKMMSFKEIVLSHGFYVKKVLPLDLQWIDKQGRHFLSEEHFGEMFWNG